MRINKLSLIAAGLLSLAACSTTGNHAGGAGAGANGGVQSYGLGSGSGINGLDSGLTTKAPSDQSYYFEFDKSNVAARYFPSIDAQSNYLVAHQSGRILLAGNTDAKGSHEYNIALGERRAQAVASRVLSNGAAKSQLRIVSYGDMKPRATGNTEDDYMQNRRVDLTFLGK